MRPFHEAKVKYAGAKRDSRSSAETLRLETTTAGNHTKWQSDQLARDLLTRPALASGAETEQHPAQREETDTAEDGGEHERLAGRTALCT